MKYARFITTISLVFLTAHVWACSPDIYYPTGYYLFHLVDLPDNASRGFNLNGEENCRLWQQQTSSEIPLDDIYQLVYKYDIETLAALKVHDIPLPARENKMAQWRNNSLRVEILVQLYHPTIFIDLLRIVVFVKFQHILQILNWKKHPKP